MIFTPFIAVDSDKVDGAHASATPTSSTVPIADVNGKLDGWVTANITDHGALTGLADDDHTQYIKHSLATALSDFLVASGAGAFVKKTLAEVKTILGLGSAAYTDSTAYLPASNPTVTGTLTLGADLKSGSAGANALTYTANGGHIFVGAVTGTGLVSSDGWTPATGTWTYASATTITVPSGAAAIYKVGQGIRLTANGVVLYAYIVAVANTVLTVIGNALTNHTFGAISYTNTPGTAIGFPEWFATAAPTFTVTTYDNGSGGQPTTNDYRFSLDGRKLTAHYKGSGVKASSTNYISLAPGLPPPANYTTYNVIGSAWVPGSIGVFITTTNPYIEFSATIADNAVIGNLSFFVIYEI